MNLELKPLNKKLGDLDYPLSSAMDSPYDLYYLLNGRPPRYFQFIKNRKRQFNNAKLISYVRVMLNNSDTVTHTSTTTFINAEGCLLILYFGYTKDECKEHACNTEAWFEHFKNHLLNDESEQANEYGVRISFFYSDKSDCVPINDIIQELRKIPRHVEDEEQDDKNYINIVRTTSNGALTTMRKELKSIDNNFGIDDLYNDDFAPIHDRIMHELTNESKGLVLLHGDPGTGKTSYVKHIISQLKKKSVIYMPPTLAPSMAQPAFMSFLMDECADSVIVIEDAENVLMERKGGGNDAVSNILNTTDGMLGDALNIQFVCTFNCDVSDIDTALFRPGRLIEQYKFEKLEKNKARTLMRKYYRNDEISVTDDMTLGEIFNHEEIINPVEDEKKHGFGFMNTK